MGLISPRQNRTEISSRQMAQSEVRERHEREETSLLIVEGAASVQVSGVVDHHEVSSLPLYFFSKLLVKLPDLLEHGRRYFGIVCKRFLVVGIWTSKTVCERELRTIPGLFNRRHNVVNR